MALFNNPPPVASKSLRVLARLLGYPDADLRANLPALRDALHGERALSPPRLAELDALIAAIERAAPLDAEADYVQLFDRGRATSLHLFEHVHGDSRERGPAMIDLAQTYEAAGLYLAEGELPDFMPVVLEFTSTQPPAQARAFLAEMAHIFIAIFAALQQRGSSSARAPPSRSISQAPSMRRDRRSRPITPAASRPDCACCWSKTMPRSAPSCTPSSTCWAARSRAAPAQSRRCLRSRPMRGSICC